eukprot:m.189896 g.189896  ORF g.189896 m.189896 type:complete len:351 (-) comp18537_c0_seq2:182-1234(-)
MPRSPLKKACLRKRNSQQNDSNLSPRSAGNAKKVQKSSPKAAKQQKPRRSNHSKMRNSVKLTTYFQADRASKSTAHSELKGIEAATKCQSGQSDKSESPKNGGTSKRNKCRGSNNCRTATSCSNGELAATKKKERTDTQLVELSTKRTAMLKCGGSSKVIPEGVYSWPREQFLQYLDRWSVTPSNRVKALRTFAAVHGDATLLGADDTVVSSTAPISAFQPLCSVCGQRFENTLRATVHVATHVDPASTDGTDGTDTTAAHLTSTATHGGASQPHQCEFCLDVFSSQRDFETHHKRVHAPEAAAFVQGVREWARGEVAQRARKSKGATKGSTRTNASPAGTAYLAVAGPF